jgi:hypothetical protein
MRRDERQETLALQRLARMLGEQRRPRTDFPIAAEQGVASDHLSRLVPGKEISRRLFGKGEGAGDREACRPITVTHAKRPSQALVDLVGDARGLELGLRDLRQRHEHELDSRAWEIPVLDNRSSDRALVFVHDVVGGCDARPDHLQIPADHLRVC